MATLNTVEATLHRRGMPRLKRANLKIDMTPMVDLGFLLICFFVITTTMSEPRAVDLFMPMEGPPIHLAESKTLTLLLGDKDHIFYYHGDWENASKNNGVFSTDYSLKNGIGNIIRKKQEMLQQLKHDKEGSRDLVLIIKASKESSYKNFIDAMDEVLINGIIHYVVVEPSTNEIQYVQSIMPRK